MVIGLDIGECDYSLIKDFKIAYKLKERLKIDNKFLYTNLLRFVKLVFTDLTQGTNEIFGYVFPLCTRCYSAFGAARQLVIKYDNGILRLTVPKSQPKQPKKDNFISIE